MESRLKRIYAQTPEPKAVMVIGNCGVEGDVFHESYNLVGPIDQIIPVDVYVHGSPATVLKPLSTASSRHG